MKKLDSYKQIAKSMVADDKERDRAYRAYDAMYHNDWQLPEGLQALQWVRPVISTEPHDAVEAGVRVLSALQPKITFYPLASNQATKQKANDNERVLLWQLWSSDRRRQASIVRDAVRSAIMYHEVVARVDDLDYLIEQKRFANANTNRLKAARRFGRFMVTFWNPQDVHVRYSNVMPEAVLLRTVMTAQQVLDEYGDLAKGLKKYAREAEENERPGYVTLFDYTDYEARCVWAVPCESTTPREADGGDGVTILPPTEWELPFLPWVARVGGSTLEKDTQHKRHPLLYSVYTAGQWHNLNIAETLIASKAISLAGTPVTKEEGGNPLETVINYDDPTMPAKVPVGNKLDVLNPPPIDPKLFDLRDNLKGAINKSTVSSVLSNPDIPSGAAFAAINLVTQTAVGALRPYQELAEGALEDVLTLELLWCSYTGKDLYAYGTDKENLGAEYVIRSDEIADDAIYIKVELQADVPTDRIQKINAAVMAVKELGFSKEKALEEIGVSDPNAEMKQHYFELLADAKIQNAIMAEQEQVRAQIQLQVQQAMAGMQMQAQQAQAAQGQEMALREAQAMMGPQGIPGAEGMGMNPGAGGMPPQVMAPEATREGQTGTARNGAGVAEVGGA